MPEIPVLMAKSSRFPTFATRILTMMVLVLVLISCGGGGGGSSSMLSGGGPMVMPEQPEVPEQPQTPQPTEPMLNTGLGQITGWRNNPSAEDLLDHWNDPDGLRQGIGAELVGLSGSDASAHLDTLRTILQTPTDTLDESKTLLRNVDAGAMTVVGERDGITYGQWKGGPAGTLDIDFDYRFAPELVQSTRARMERAGKMWSWRLQDDFDMKVLRKGREIRFHDVLWHVLDEDVSTDDMLILIVDKRAGGTSTGGATGPRKRTADDYEPSFGRILLSSDARESTDIMAHEIGHVLGISSGVFPSKTRYTNMMDYTFEGPEAMRANGGAPVPFMWRDQDNRPVPPHTLGAEVDYGHLGVCASLMAYCRDRSEVYRPSELDFAFLADIGYEVLDADTASDPEIYGYGAWGRHSAWGAGVERTINHDVEGNNVVTEDRLRAGADAFGVAPTESLSDGFAAQGALQGSVTWSGSLIGVDLGSAHLPPVFGDAEVTVDLTSLDGTANFNNLTVVNNGQAGTFRAPNLDYAIEVTGNSFSDSGGRVHGGFFGPAHEEMAGVLRDEASNVNLLGGFGGTR